jgi:hypothetical protein
MRRLGVPLHPMAAVQACGRANITGMFAFFGTKSQKLQPANTTNG